MKNRLLKENYRPIVTTEIRHGFLLIWMGDVGKEVLSGAAGEYDFRFEGEEAKKILRYFDRRVMDLMNAGFPVVSMAIPDEYIRIVEEKMMKKSQLKTVIKEIFKSLQMEYNTELTNDNLNVCDFIQGVGEMIVNKDEKPGADMFGFVNVEEDSGEDSDLSKARKIADQIWKGEVKAVYLRPVRSDSKYFKVDVGEGTPPMWLSKAAGGRWLYSVGEEMKPFTGTTTELTNPDGTYTDDMESGMKSKYMSGLKEGIHDERPCDCDCGSGQMSHWEEDGQGIPLCRVCPACKQKKLSRYRPEILRHYTQADVDEPIEPDDPSDLYESMSEDELLQQATKIAQSKFGSKVASVFLSQHSEPEMPVFVINFRRVKDVQPPNSSLSYYGGRWNLWDTMERKFKPLVKENEFDGYKAPKHNATVTDAEMKEAQDVASKIFGGVYITRFHSKGLNGWQIYFEVSLHSPNGEKRWICKGKNGQWLMSVGKGESSRWVAADKHMAEQTGAVAGFATPNAFKKKRSVDEMTSSGAAGGQPGGTIQVPAWGTKNKMGSPRAIAATVGHKGHKTGFKVVKSISEKVS